MTIKLRQLVIGVLIVAALFNGVMGVFFGGSAVAWVLASTCLVFAATALLFGRRESKAVVEPGEISDLSSARHEQLIRGTGLHLREIKYRFSVRLDRNATADRRCFSKEINTIPLGFVPVVITDNTSGRQGYGFVAFVHDGRRWCGPGLPCPGDRERAQQHARRCVSPIDQSDD